MARLKATSTGGEAEAAAATVGPTLTSGYTSKSNQTGGASNIRRESMFSRKNLNKKSCPSSALHQTITVIEQLIQNSQSITQLRIPPPPPFFMCSESEAWDRQHHLELSPFECNASSPSRGAILISHYVSPNSRMPSTNKNVTPFLKNKDPNEIRIESPTPKRSSLAAAAAAAAVSPSLSSSYKSRSTHYSEHNNTSNNYSIKSTSNFSPYELNPISVTSPSTEKSTTAKKITPTAPSTNTLAASTPTTLKAARSHRPTFNPNYVVKKYRRSAAGWGVSTETSEKHSRTLEQLNATVDYLVLNILVWQMPPPFARNGGNEVGRSVGNVSRNSENSLTLSSAWGEDYSEVSSGTDMQQQQQHMPFSLCETVAFVDDRLRAVQKDLVTFLGNFEEPPDILKDECIPFNSNAHLQQQYGHQHQLQVQQQQSLQQQAQVTMSPHPIKFILRRMQARMVRYNILSLYLLSEVPLSKFEVKFGTRALRKSLTCYLNLSLSLHDEYHPEGKTAYFTNEISADSCQYEEECQTKDEMMAYMALLHSSAVLRSEEIALPPPSLGEVTSTLMEESGCGWGALLSTFSKHILSEEKQYCTSFLGEKRQLSVEKYPRWKWALELACMAQEGNYQRYFCLLEHGPTVSAGKKTKSSTAIAVNNARFLIMARCCASHSLNLIRLSSLRRYNHAFGKAEEVAGDDLARLL